MPQDIFDEYEVVSDEARILTGFLLEVSNRAGNPPLVEGKAGWAVIDAIMKTWSGFFPEEVSALRHDLKNELEVERPIRQAIKQNGGYTKIIYPPKLYMLLRTMFPAQSLSDKKFTDEFIRRYPQLKGTNYKI